MKVISWNRRSNSGIVAPHTGAWIEGWLIALLTTALLSRPPYGGVD